MACATTNLLRRCTISAIRPTSQLIATRWTSRFCALVDEARNDVKEILPKEAHANQASYTFVDVREHDEWVTKGVIDVDELLTLERGVLERKLEIEVPDLDAPLVLYCAGAMRSVLAAESIQKMGYSNVQSLIGGFGQWADGDKLPIRDFQESEE
eukprot:m.267918 g.267918  ORF g.267918 m.267918 type:complete len:155 (+) comp17644_c0_seq7:286-750(+)